MPQTTALYNIMHDINANDDSISRALRVIVARFRSSEDENESDEEFDNALHTLHSALSNSIDNAKLNSRLSSFENYCDGKFLQLMLDKLEGQIQSYGGAMTAIESFGIDWFRGLALSNSGKQQVASKLNELTQRYTKSTNDFWLRLIGGDAVMLDKISFDLYTKDIGQ